MTRVSCSSSRPRSARSSPAPTSRRPARAAPKPTPEAIKTYYDEKPALFKERRIYSIQELAIEATPDQVPALREHLQAAKSISDFVEYLKANNFKFSGNQAVRAAEQLPLNMLDAFAKMKDGQAILAPTPTGAQVIVLAGSRTEPVDEARARPAIEQFLWNDAKRKLLEADMKSMRAAAKIEYVGKFAESRRLGAGGGLRTGRGDHARRSAKSASAWQSQPPVRSARMTLQKEWG